MFKTDMKSGIGKDIYFVTFGDWSVEVSNDFDDKWTEDDFLEGSWYGPWLIHKLWYKDMTLNFDTSDRALTLIREEYAKFKKMSV